jgi:glyoxylase-like metal-dependent hydrolase (beta-lactamase superfamily II)
MKDYVVVVEAPFFEERSVAVIKAIEDKIPNKPIKYLVLTHFHIDHTGGTRAFAAKGATILSDEKNAEFVKTMLARPKTVKPDSFAKAGNVMPDVEGFKDAKTLTDGDRTIELREIANPHADGMIVVYLPKEKMLFESDLFTPGQPVDPTNAQGIENAAALQAAIISLKIDGIIGGHGNIGTMSELSKIVALGKKSS